MTRSVVFRVEASYESFDESWTVIIWKGDNGVSIGVPIRDEAKAKRLAKQLEAVLLPEYIADREQSRALSAKFHQEAEHRIADQAAVRRGYIDAITAETPRMEYYVCPECGDGTDSADDYEQPVYECSRCNGFQVGEGENRCEECNIFMAKVSDIACPSCLEALEEVPEATVGVVLESGEFLTEEQLIKEVI
jgi:hypothetical protein